MLLGESLVGLDGGVKCFAVYCANKRIDTFTTSRKDFSHKYEEAKD